MYSDLVFISFCILLSISACSGLQQTAPVEDTKPTRAEAFKGGHERLQALARTEPNEHLAFFVEWSDGTFSWGRWTEGGPVSVLFPLKKWVKSLCRMRVRHITIAHTHVIDVPPSEPDVVLLRRTVRLLEPCAATTESLVVTPETTWVLKPLSGKGSCAGYRSLWKSVPGRVGRIQESIERVGKRSKILLPAYYRCVHRIEAHFFEDRPTTSRK